MDELCEFLGLRFADPNTTELEIGSHHINPAGTLSGAVTYALVDYGMGRALWDIKERDESVLTVDISISYLRGATAGRIVCRTGVDRKTDSFAMLSSEVRHGGHLLARAIGTFAVIASGE